MSLCPNCKNRPKQKHSNSKWCKPCAVGFKRRPKPNLTPYQRREALRLRGKITKEEIAEQIGASRSSVMRLGRDLKLSFNACNQYKLNPIFVKQVCEYYSKHGKAKTLERFPGINLRSIVERYNTFPPRQVRWTDDQLKELARMAGIVSIKAQFKYFDRPGAHEGAIVSAWMKKFRMGGGCVNGLSWHMARNFVTQDCKPIQTKFWRQREGVLTNNVGRNIVLWVDLQKHLKPDSPPWLIESIDALANFQVWLHGSSRVRFKIHEMIRTVEL
jgi:DNA-binding XRE family transcriptional regulator